ncbi:hypothetical protein EDD90_3242 [Streptomyces sp. Ag109_O5-1]|uniref:hypothetical protein n=1 Tax=Streptomyces sp. Ag109_O5-1 TaxID=1938851 RepID=UPI000F4DDC8F|nr:hypothetical protein [Streptomyces sp. Ag109_O5-1]RPE40206.1 hypothetical protein EDD90_3242 [Streptomyces sp. Ag109_O5-1]
MTTEITFRPGLEGLMAALSVAEQVTAASPAVPDQVNLTSAHFDYVPGTDFQRPTGVLLFFHRSIEQVREFAAAFGLETADRAHGETDVYTYAEGVLNGVPFRAWTLTAVEAPAVAA